MINIKHQQTGNTTVKKSTWIKNISLDCARYFLNRWVLKLNLKGSNVDTVRKERGRELQIMGLKMEKKASDAWNSQPANTSRGKRSA